VSFSFCHRFYGFWIVVSRFSLAAYASCLLRKAPPAAFSYEDSMGKRNLGAMSHSGGSGILMKRLSVDSRFAFRYDSPVYIVAKDVSPLSSCTETTSFDFFGRRDLACRFHLLFLRRNLPLQHNSTLRGVFLRKYPVGVVRERESFSLLHSTLLEGARARARRPVD
jgi:hypothetical protein